MAFYNINKYGFEAIKDIPIATTYEELINKRCKFVGSSLPFVIVDGKGL